MSRRKPRSAFRPAVGLADGSACSAIRPRSKRLSKSCEEPRPKRICSADDGARSHLRCGRNRPALGKVPLAAVENLGRDHARCYWIRGPKAEAEAGILADRNVRFEPEYRLAVVGDLERLHEVGRDVVSANLIHLQPRTVRVTNQELGFYRGIGPG